MKLDFEKEYSRKFDGKLAIQRIFEKRIDFYSKKNSKSLVEKMEMKKKCQNETSRKQQKQSIDSCELCVVLHTFAHFRFSIGLGSFHGEWINNEEKSAVGKFMELILGWKKKTNSRLYAAKDISQLHKYFSNLAQMSIQLHEILLKIEDFANRLKNLGEKKERAFVPQNNLRLKKIQNSRKCVSTSWPKFKTACQELAHLATVSAENRELQQEHQEVAQVPKIENGSGILYQQEFYESLVRPDMSVQEKLEQKMNQNAEINVFTKLFNERATMAEKKNVIRLLKKRILLPRKCFMSTSNRD